MEGIKSSMKAMRSRVNKEIEGQGEMIVRLQAELATPKDDDTTGMATKEKADFHAITDWPRVRCNAEGCRMQRRRVSQPKHP